MRMTPPSWSPCNTFPAGVRLRMWQACFRRQGEKRSLNQRESPCLEITNNGIMKVDHNPPGLSINKSTTVFYGLYSFINNFEHCKMQFQRFYWLSGHCIGAIKWRPLNCVLVVLSKRIQQDLAIFQFVFNKTIIALALVGYGMIIANHLISYATHARGIIVRP